MERLHSSPPRWQEDALGLGYSAFTPLIAAAVEGSVECVRLLLAAKADLARKGQGRRALQWAQRKQHVACALLLRESVNAKGIFISDPRHPDNDPASKWAPPPDPGADQSPSDSCSELSERHRRQ